MKAVCFQSVYESAKQHSKCQIFTFLYQLGTESVLFEIHMYSIYNCASELSCIGQRIHTFHYLNKALAPILRPWLFFPSTAANNFSFLSLLLSLLPMFCIASLWQFNNFILPLCLFFPFLLFPVYVRPSILLPIHQYFILSLHFPSIICRHSLFLPFCLPVHHLSPQALKWREYRRKNPLGVERGKDGHHSLSCALENKTPGTRVMRRNVFDFPPTNQPLSFGRLNGAEPISVTQWAFRGRS